MTTPAPSLLIEKTGFALHVGLVFEAASNGTTSLVVCPGSIHVRTVNKSLIARSADDAKRAACAAIDELLSVRSPWYRLFPD